MLWNQETQYSQVSQLSQDAQKDVNDVTKTQVEGAKNATTEVELQALAKAAETNLITGTTIAVKLETSAMDQGLASTTRLGSMAGVTGILSQGIGRVANCMNMSGQYSLNLNGAINTFNGAFGTWSTNLSPLVTSFGSIAETGAGLEELDLAVATDINTLGSDDEAANEDSKFDQNNNSERDVKDEKDNSNAGEDNNDIELETPKVKLREFGI